MVGHVPLPCQLCPRAHAIGISECLCNAIPPLTVLQILLILTDLLSDVGEEGRAAN